jgi:hypothetical protein
VIHCENEDGGKPIGLLPIQIPRLRRSAKRPKAASFGGWSCGSGDAHRRKCQQWEHFSGRSPTTLGSAGWVRLDASQRNRMPIDTRFRQFGRSRTSIDSSILVVKRYPGSPNTPAPRLRLIRMSDITKSSPLCAILVRSGCYQCSVISGRTSRCASNSGAEIQKDETAETTSTEAFRTPTNGRFNRCSVRTEGPIPIRLE